MLYIQEIAVEETYALRIEILRKGIPENYHFVGDTLKSTFHLGAFEDDSCVGIVSFILKSHPLIPTIAAYQLRGMAVSQEFQKQGVGKLLIQESYQYLKERNCKIVWCNAREIALDFYTKMGFTIKGKAFYISKIGKHFMMWREVIDGAF